MINLLTSSISIIFKGLTLVESLLRIRLTLRSALVKVCGKFYTLIDRFVFNTGDANYGEISFILIGAPAPILTEAVA